MNWKESTTLDEHPWKKIGTVALGNSFYAFCVFRKTVVNDKNNNIVDCMLHDNRI